MNTSKLISSLDQRWYPQSDSNWDDELFRRIVLTHVDASSVLLDLGAGAGIVKEMDFRGVARRICGVDLDERVLANPFLHEAKVGSAEAIPYGADEFDVVLADNVLEHLPEPEKAFAEIQRVLKPGGWFLAKTPNKWHYMPMAARLTPHAFHRYYNRLRGRQYQDTFPTRYRANTARRIRSLASGSGLIVDRITLIEGRPEYLRVHPLAYAAGFAYERLVNASRALEVLRILLIVELRRPE